MKSPTDIYRGLNKAGLYGSLKSLYYSKKHTNKYTSLIFHSKVITEISQNTEFNIKNHFLFGVGESGATHPRIGRSKFSTQPGSSVSQTGEIGSRIGPRSIIHIEGNFSMGDSYINSDCRIICGDEITIGDDVAIAWGVELLDDDRHKLMIDGEESPHTEPIQINNNVWIGHNVSIHKGVTIHKGSVVSSDSVVVSDVPPNTLVAGCPAEVVREDVTWDA